MGQTHAFVQAKQDVQVLYRLTRRALDQVIDDREHYDQVATLWPMDRNAANVGTPHATSFRVAAGWHDIDKRLICITLFEQRLQVNRGIGNGGVQGRVDTPDHWRQMRHKGQTDITTGRTAQALANFWKVTVPFDRICLHAFTGFAEQRPYAGATASTADTGLAVGDQARGISNAGLKQWQESQLGSGWIATRDGNQARLANLLTVDLGKP